MSNLRSRSGFWIETAISYPHTNEKGVTKDINEKYLVEAADFGQAEERIRKEMNCDNRTIRVKTVTRPKYAEICFDDGSGIDTFFKVKVVIHEEVETKGGTDFKIKDTKKLHIVQAADVESARQAVNEGIYKKSMLDYDIDDVVKTKLIGILEYGKHIERSCDDSGGGLDGKTGSAEEVQCADH